MKSTIALIAAAALTTACSTGSTDEAKLRPGPVAEPKAVELIGRSANSIACLTEAIYFEAHAHSEPGRAAVAHVILNRAADPRFPGSVCSVVEQGEASGACQFSYRCTMDTARIRWPEKHRAAQKTATAALEGQAADPTGGALFFHAATIPAGWFGTLERLGNFGGNIFYR